MLFRSTLRHLESACRDVKILALGDKLSNIRSTASDYLVHGDRVFLRFNEKKKEKHAWYYLGIAKALEELTLEIRFKDYFRALRASYYPGVIRLDDFTVSYTARTMDQLMTARMFIL